MCVHGSLLYISKAQLTQNGRLTEERINEFTHLNYKYTYERVKLGFIFGWEVLFHNKINMYSLNFGYLFNMHLFYL